MTSSQFKARYEGGVLAPLEAVDLTEGCVVTVSVSTEEPATEEPAADIGGGAAILRMIDELHRQYPPETLGEHPPDFVKNKKHYLYGHPKEED